MQAADCIFKKAVRRQTQEVKNIYESFNAYFSKVVLIIVIAVACRKEELINLVLENVLSFRQNVSKNSFGCALI